MQYIDRHLYLFRKFSDFQIGSNSDIIYRAQPFDTNHTLTIILALAGVAWKVGVIAGGNRV
ncbi:hypothetical protein HanIR_Chr04g0189501 [Helianthus annuus]|nr:hypothetical protein HanIR_Chr04g0189501 [Helianthus annuus]